MDDVWVPDFDPGFDVYFWLEFFRENPLKKIATGLIEGQLWFVRYRAGRTRVKLKCNWARKKTMCGSIVLEVKNRLAIIVIGFKNPIGVIEWAVLCYVRCWARRTWVRCSAIICAVRGLFCKF